MNRCTNDEPCLRWVEGQGGHSLVCQRLVLQGAKPRGPARPAQPAKLNPPQVEAARGDGRIGCACGQVVLSSRDAVYSDEYGTQHVYGKPCRPPVPGELPEKAGRASDQPLPVDGVGEGMHQRISRLLLERAEVGLRRYGKPLQAFNGRDVFRDLQEELLDGLAYSEQAKVEWDSTLEALITLGQHARGDKVEPVKLNAAMLLFEKLEALHGR